MKGSRTIFDIIFFLDNLKFWKTWKVAKIIRKIVKKIINNYNEIAYNIAH